MKILLLAISNHESGIMCLNLQLPPPPPRFGAGQFPNRRKPGKISDPRGTKQPLKPKSASDGTARAAAARTQLEIIIMILCEGL